MSKFTSTLALALVAMGMNAQVTMPNSSGGPKLLSANELNQMDKSKKIAIYLAHQGQKNTWFVGEDKANSGRTTTFSSEVVFLWEGNTTEGHTLKKAYPNGNISGYLAASSPNDLTAEVNSAAKFEVVKPQKDGSGNTAIKWDSNCPAENDPNYVNLTRFVNKSNPTTWVNSNATGWNQGTGAWTLFYVYDMTDYYTVTLELKKDGQTTTEVKLYKKGDKIEIPTHEGYTFTPTEFTKTADDNQKVTVNYTPVSWDNKVTALAADAQKLVEASKTGKVGYPTNTTALEAAIEGAKVASQETYTALQTAIAGFKNDVSAVNLPVDGKAYKIEAVYPNGTAQALYFNDDASVNRIFNGNNPKENDAVFVCHKVGDKFMFVNNRGQYLLWFDSGDADKSQSKDGYTTTYNAQFNDWTLSRADMTESNGGTIQSGTTNEQLFGLLMMQGNGKDNNTYYLNTNTNGNFVSGGANGKWYDAVNNDHRTFAFRFTEVSYANEVSLKAIEGTTVNIANAKSIATFSAPFATTIPADVTAYYVAQNSVQGNVATLTQVTGTIPANTGVILTGTEVKNVTMVPATEAGTTITNNQLGHSAGAAKDLSKETSFYILGKGSNGEVGFFKGATTSGATLGMNKAYLTADAAAQAIQLQFGGETTGIEAVEGVQQTNAAIFDLSGRRVFQTVKGGLYIQNGKKFIAQ